MEVVNKIAEIVKFMYIFIFYFDPSAGKYHDDQHFFPNAVPSDKCHKCPTDLSPPRILVLLVCVLVDLPMMPHFCLCKTKHIITQK